jgi:protein O-GlcNAc transferase
MNAAAKFGQAVASLQQGRVERAETLCRELIRAQPRHAPALHLLGIISLQRGDATGGAEFLRRSLEGDPGQATVHCNLGNALREARQPEAALECYGRALQLAPEFAGALYNRGNALLDLNRAEEALDSFDKAIALQRDYAEAYNNRGNALLSLGRLEAALQSYRGALALRPDFALARSNCAHVLQQMAVVRYDSGNTCLAAKQYERALADYDAALRLDPHLLEARCNRGLSLLGLDRPGEALESFTTALTSRPDFAEAFHGRGRALRALGRKENALADFDQALQLLPDSADILYRRAAVLRELHRYEEAARCFAQVLSVAPEYDYASGNLVHARLQTCDWMGYGDSVRQIEQHLETGKRVVLPGPFLAFSHTADAQLECARIFVADKHGTPPPALWKGESYQHDKIRIAYVSADLREHPVSILLVGVLEQHDRNRFETFGISLRPPEDTPFGERVKSAFSRFIDVSGKSDQDIAVLLRELEIDIAVDLMGFTGSGRAGVFTRRAAPVQVNYLGYTATTALPCMDYIIADATVIPEADQRCYSEKVVYLPDCYQPGDSRRGVPEVTPTREQCGLPESGFVFCCFNNHYKIGPEVFHVWMRLLAATAGSFLWLAAGNGTMARNLRAEAERRGIAPERIVFAPRVADSAEHLARYRVADLFLDTLPFNAHATANDALWMGLPVLTCQGGTFAGRVASSLLRAVGLPELVTGTLEEYEELALKLAATPALLLDLRARLARNRGEYPLFNTTRYCRHLETAYVTMWQRAQSRTAPEHFAVPPRPPL